MTTIHVKEIKTAQISTQHYQDRNDAIAAGKWYVNIKENGSKKYQVIISKA
jgi:hypothetical protein